MDARAVYDVTQSVVPEHRRSSLSQCGKSLSDINQFFLHQTNSQIVDPVDEKAGFIPQPDLSSSFRKYGNFTCALIPVQIYEILSRARQNNGRMLYCGFGIGLSWGSALIDLNGLHTKRVRDYDGKIPENYEQEFIKHWKKVFTDVKND